MKDNETIFPVDDSNSSNAASSQAQESQDPDDVLAEALIRGIERANRLRKSQEPQKPQE